MVPKSVFRLLRVKLKFDLIMHSHIEDSANHLTVSSIICYIRDCFTPELVRLLAAGLLVP